MAIAWHRIFGMALTQYLAGTGWKVDVEVDLSLQQQRLDLVVLPRATPGPEPVWPDGFGTPAPYNLLTFKAPKDPLDAFALKELVAHSVSYRKWISPAPDRLLPESDIRLLAATMQYPRGLAGRIALRPQSPGAYDVQWGTDTIRVLVLHEMPAAAQNLLWNLFSGDPARIATAFQRMQAKRAPWSALVNQLLTHYGLEGMAMPYTMEDFEREVLEEALQKATPEQRLAGLSPEQLVRHLSPEQLVQHLSPEQLVQCLSSEEIERYLRTLQAARDKDTSP